MGNVWCIHYYEYAAKIQYNDRDLDLEPCHIGICEPYSSIRYHSIRTDENCHFCFNFQLMGNASSDQWKIPLLIPKVHRVFSGIAPRLKRAIDIYIESPLDAEVELWSILLALSDKQISLGMEQVDTLDQRRVRDACSLIESGLNGAIYAEVIAETLEISVSQLGRIFKRRLGCPVATYIRRRRVQLAHELLCYSEEPIQEVATRVGVPDLANFNRMLKREFKLSPREIRERKNGLSVRELD